MKSETFLGLLITTNLAIWSPTGIVLAEETIPWSTLKVPADAVANVHDSQLAAALRGLEPTSAGKWTVNGERSRGPALNVYSQVAPATVVVRTRRGHGTGFVIDPLGWIITNHHVIEPADVDPASGALRAMVYFGRWNGGENRMELVEKGVPGLVYQESEALDLALIKITEFPEELKVLPALKLAEKSPSPGSDCVSIGHPKAGMLWTVRSGEVAGVARWPREMIDAVMSRLSATNEDRQRLEKQISAIPPRNVLLSSCGINPGDSGGPLVNSKGELIAVTFGVPKGNTESGNNLDKFSYHIHLDDLKMFLMTRPDQPPVHVPDPWPEAIFVKDRDANGNKTVDTLMFGMKQDQNMTGFLVDVDEDSGRRFTPEQLSNPSKNKAWDFEFAYQLAPFPRAFYDTDGDGKLDLILSDANQDGTVEAALTFKNEAWHPTEPPSGKLVNAAFFMDDATRVGFAKIMQALSGGSK